MKNQRRRMKIGILGCGAIGSGIAKSIPKQLKDHYQLSGLYDIDLNKTKSLEHSLQQGKLMRSSLADLINHCDLMVEAVNAVQTRPLIRKALIARKDVLAMSVGKLLTAKDLFRLARTQKSSLLLPSGAIAGIDAIKAASLSQIKSIILSTRKPPISFENSTYVKEKGINLLSLKKEVILFEGNVETAVKYFPQNINVAATVALASLASEKLTIRIIISPRCTINSHEIEVSGDFGRIFTRTENIVCPDNPKTSYLAVLSAIQTLKQFSQTIQVGT